MSYVSSKDIRDLGNTTKFTNEIQLTDDIPVRDPYRRLPPAQLDYFRVAVQIYYKQESQGSLRGHMLHWLCWFERKMADCERASTFASLTLNR